MISAALNATNSAVVQVLDDSALEALSQIHGKWRPDFVDRVITLFLKTAPALLTDLTIGSAIGKTNQSCPRVGREARARTPGARRDAGYLAAPSHRRQGTWRWAPAGGRNPAGDRRCGRAVLAARWGCAALETNRAVTVTGVERISDGMVHPHHQPDCGDGPSRDPDRLAQVAGRIGLGLSRPRAATVALLRTQPVLEGASGNHFGNPFLDALDQLDSRFAHTAGVVRTRQKQFCRLG
jgi:hypothetical protein